MAKTCRLSSLSKSMTFSVLSRSARAELPNMWGNRLATALHTMWSRTSWGVVRRKRFSTAFLEQINSFTGSSSLMAVEEFKHLLLLRAYKPISMWMNSCLSGWFQQRRNPFNFPQVSSYLCSKKRVDHVWCLRAFSRRTFNCHHLRRRTGVDRVCGSAPGRWCSCIKKNVRHRRRCPECRHRHAGKKSTRYAQIHRRSLRAALQQRNRFVRAFFDLRHETRQLLAATCEKGLYRTADRCLWPRHVIQVSESEPRTTRTRHSAARNPMLCNYGTGFDGKRRTDCGR